MKKTAVLLVLVVAIAGCKRGEAPQGTRGAATTTGSEVGALMPDYSAMNLDGTKFDLATRKDKVVLLNIWATWCGPCVYEIPELQRIHDHYAARGFEVVGASVDESGLEVVKQFVDDHKMRYPIVLDPQGQIANLLQASVLPTSVLVDRSGKIVWKRTGLIPEGDPELKQAIEKAL